jgi:hypothetical protein
VGTGPGGRRLTRYRRLSLTAAGLTAERWQYAVWQLAALVVLVVALLVVERRSRQPAPVT